MAVVVEAILAGLIPESAEAIEPYVTNNQSSIERQVVINLSLVLVLERR